MALEKDAEIVALDDALIKLAEVYPENARVVELRYFGGYTNEETSGILSESVARVALRWEQKVSMGRPST
jgi:RNA polymerase sigma-70 factor (ECF subfamily)